MTRRTLLRSLFAAASTAALPWPRAVASPTGSPLEALRAEYGVVGMGQVSVTARGAASGALDVSVQTAVAGLRRANDPALILPSDAWHIGSNTKAMTAGLAARLVEKGQIAWTTTLGQRFPDDAAAMSPAWREVRLEQLLRMQAGVPADILQTKAWKRFWLQREPVTALRHMLLREITAAPPVAPPGEQFLYSNASYILAGAMLEAATGQPWEALMAAEVFGPLGLASAGFGAPKGDAPWGHTPDKRFGMRPVDPASLLSDNPPALGPAGTVHIGLADYGRWLGEAMAGQQGKSQWLSAESWATIRQPGPGSYAMGWGVKALEGMSGPALVHAGSNTMWFVQAVAAPERAVAVFANAATPKAQEAVQRAVKAWVEGA